MEEDILNRTRAVVGSAAIMALIGGLIGQGAMAQDPVKLTYLVSDTQSDLELTQGLVDAYTALNPNVSIEIEARPGGADGDNIVKTRLATGEMTDIFYYNSGSLLQALNPTETLVDLSGEPFVANIADAFLPTVSKDGGVYGVPTGTAMGGGILYNKKIYADLGLSVPTTWAEFEANNEAIKAAGIAPVGATFKDTWTSQLFVLADYYNVQAAIPDFAEKYTGNQIKYATTPEALAGFTYLQEGFEKGWWQEDFGSATYDDGLNMLAAGEIAHYPMLSFALPTIAANNPDAIADIGFFAQPGTDPAKNGATLWMPPGTYIPTTSSNIEEAKKFLGFIASVEGTDAATAVQPPSGPYVIKGATLPEDTLGAVKDIQAYIDNDLAAPALEFVSPIKGPALEQITVEVGSGLRSAEDGAALYDQDVEKQAKQLGLPGW
jgi:raffinose/stachyose/melibiose transport system substrate-binding protein